MELVLDGVVRAASQSDTSQGVFDDMIFAARIARLTRRFVSSSTVMPLKSVSTAKEALSALALMASIIAAFSDLFT